MASHALQINVDALVQCRDEVWRIVSIHDFSRILAVRIDDGFLDFLNIEDLAPLGSSEATPNEIRNIAESSQPLSDNEHQRKLANRIIRPMSLSPKEAHKIEETVRRHKIIFRIAQLPVRKRKDAITKAALELNTSIPTIYRWVAITIKNESADALQRSIRADKGKRRLSPESIQIVRSLLRKYRGKAERKTLERTHVLINGALSKKGLKSVSIETIRRIELEKPLKDRLNEQGRVSEVKKHFSVKIGHLPGSDYPLAIVQIDHTTTQIIFVDDDDREPIGDAWLTLVIDTYSRMVLGFFITLDPPSNLSVGTALAHAILPKERYLRSLGIDGEWPCWGYPDIVHVDNGADLNSDMMHEARRKFVFDITDRPVGSPELGGAVESAFRTFIRRNKEIPGTKFSNIYEHVDYDSEEHAVMTLREFEVLFTEFLVNDYHLKPHKGHDMEGVSPLEKWKKGIFEGDKCPPRGLPERPFDEMWVKLNLLPFEKRVVSHGIVEIFSGKYYSGALQQVMLDVDPHAPIDKRKFIVRYDPRDVTSKVWLFREKTQTFIELIRTVHQPPLSLWQYRYSRKQERPPDQTLAQRRLESIEKQEEMQRQSKKKTKIARKVKQRETERKRNVITTPSEFLPNAPIQDAAFEMPTEEARMKLLERLKPKK